MFCYLRDQATRRPWRTAAWAALVVLLTATATWLKTVDLRLSWPFSITERFKLDATFAVFNVFNFENFGGPGGKLNGVMDGAPGTSLNNATSPGICGSSTTFCTSRLDRILPGSGTYSNGAPRQMEFGLRIHF